MKTQLVELKKIKISKDIYPRTVVDRILVGHYTDAMRAGAIFPPITVAVVDRRLELIDGAHRMEAAKRAGKKNITAVFANVHDRLSAFEYAVRLNVTHGKVLSPYEKWMCFKKLKDAGYELERISGIIQISVKTLERNVGKRLFRTESGEEIVMKAPIMTSMRGMVGTPESLDDQSSFNTENQRHILEQTLSLFRNGWIDLKNPLILKQVKELWTLLEKVRRRK